MITSKLPPGRSTSASRVKEKSVSRLVLRSKKAAKLCVRSIFPCVVELFGGYADLSDLYKAHVGYTGLHVAPASLGPILLFEPECALARRLEQTSFLDIPCVLLASESAAAREGYQKDDPRHPRRNFDFVKDVLLSENRQVVHISKNDHVQFIVKKRRGLTCIVSHLHRLTTSRPRSCVTAHSVPPLVSQIMS